MIFSTYITGSDKTAFINRTAEIAKAIGVPVDWLLGVMYVETAKTFSSSIKNPDSGATGLIQFMPKTAIGLNTTTTALANMTRVKQLDYVYQYYKPYTGKIKKFTDLYLATFFPAALNKPENYVLQTSYLKASIVAKQNPAFDIDKNNSITVGEFRKAVMKYLPDEVKNLESFVPWMFLGIASLAFVIIYMNRN